MRGRGPGFGRSRKCEGRGERSRRKQQLGKKVGGGGGGDVPCLLSSARPCQNPGIVSLHVHEVSAITTLNES